LKGSLCVIRLFLGLVLGKQCWFVLLFDPFDANPPLNRKLVGRSGVKFSYKAVFREGEWLRKVRWLLVVGHGLAFCFGVSLVQFFWHRF